MGLTLYYLPEGPPSRGVLFLIRYLNLDVELKLCRTYMEEHKDPNYMKMNPCHTVPVLVDGDLVLIDSQAIGIYLIEQYGSKSNLFGADVKERALINQRLFFNSNLFDEVKHLVAPIIYEGQKKLDDKQLAKVMEMIGFMETFLEKSTFIALDKVTVADMYLVNNILSFLHLGFDFSKFKKILAWVDRMRPLTGFKECDDGAIALSKLVLPKLQ
ncbi:glutathione S-transferase 1-1-like [Culicoides brevitarsis]|uniref:glutathione S-transferase 1-1-like n=1 Tax=Culicoides brevitarsis TaxID=469753 RepID=UPI00307B87E4